MLPSSRSDDRLWACVYVRLRTLCYHITKNHTNDLKLPHSISRFNIILIIKDRSLISMTFLYQYKRFIIFSSCHDPHFSPVKPYRLIDDNVLFAWRSLRISFFWSPITILYLFNANLRWQGDPMTRHGSYLVRLSVLYIVRSLVKMRLNCKKSLLNITHNGRLSTQIQVYGI